MRVVAASYKLLVVRVAVSGCPNYWQPAGGRKATQLTLLHYTPLRGGTTGPAGSKPNPAHQTHDQLYD